MKKKLQSFGAVMMTLGKALMLPIAVLPIAGILLVLGLPDTQAFVTAKLAFLPSTFVGYITIALAAIGAGGGAILDSLPAIFAIGVAIGFAKDGHGAAALSGYVGYLVLTFALKNIDAAINTEGPAVNMGVFSGIVMGWTAGVLYNNCREWKVPSFLAFFGGRRLIPILTGLAGIIFAFVFALIWPTIQGWIDSFGNWVIGSGNFGLFAYGFGNRLLLPFGLHHVLNNVVWFQFGDYTFLKDGVETVVRGDLWRFYNGDPTAGSFMAGFFPVMMFGLPGACLAMVLTARPEKRKATAGIMTAAAVTAILTGITEPIEFSFMFIAFPLYVIHAVLTGLSMVIMNILQVKLGFTFSAGLFDYLLLMVRSTHPGYLWPVGAVYFALYFGMFYGAIKFFKLKTPGREEDEVVIETKTTITIPDTAAEKAEEKKEISETAQKPVEEEPAKVKVESTTEVTEGADTPLGKKYLDALGGKENIKNLEFCATRLRLELNDNTCLKEDELKKLGAKGIIKIGSNMAQVIVGTHVESVAEDIKKHM
ncbi:PTS system protein [Parelusimicrobium proximum]|uniref:PTS transporter subunit EIIC n=1 Tax=Parelusimicrobium proximum TaxID=3228953 RepID=UPI003D176013